MSDVKPASRRKFKVQISVEVELDIAQDLLEEVMTADWQGTFYHFKGIEEAVEHLAYNLVQGRSLQSLDGFAQRQANDVKFAEGEWDVDVEEIS